MSVGPEEVLGAGGHLPMGLRLGQVKWVVGEWTHGIWYSGGEPANHLD